MASEIEKTRRRGPIVITDQTTADPLKEIIAANEGKQVRHPRRRPTKDSAGAAKSDVARIKPMELVAPAIAQPTEIEKADVAGNFPVTLSEIVIAAPPEQMSDEDLASLVEAVVLKLRDYLEKYRPQIDALKARFLELPRDKYNRGKTTIAGCRTWVEFCKVKLLCTDSTMRKAMAAPKAKVEEKPKLLLAALKHLLPMADRSVPLALFSRAENGNVLLTVASEGNGWAREELPVRAPAMENVMMCDGIHPPHPARPFRWKCQIKFLMDFLKHCDGDPRCFYFVESAPMEFQEWDGQLSFIYDPRFDLGYDVNAEERDKSHYRYILPPDLSGVSRGFLEEVSAARAEQARRVEEEKQAELAAQPYAGDFLPDLKVGDDVTISIDGSEDEIKIEQVAKLTGIEIITESHQFDREGKSDSGYRILRVASDDDHFRIADEKYQQEADRQEERRVEQEFKDKRAAILAKAEELVKNTKLRLVGRGWNSDGAFYSGSSLLLSIEASVSLEELEKIVAALAADGVAGKFPATPDAEACEK